MLKQLSFLENETQIVETDEWYTFPNTIKAILKFLKPNSKILCPFDTHESQFVKILGFGTGHKVWHSHNIKSNTKYSEIGFQHYRSWSDVAATQPDSYIKALHNDFFDYTKEDMKTLGIDYIISNPPFSKRNEIFNKLFELEVPFMMLVPLVSITKKSLRDWIDQLELLFFPRRQNFFNSQGKKQGSPYDTVFVCWPGPKLEREREREKKNSSLSVNNEWL